MSTVLPQSNFPKAQNSPYMLTTCLYIYKPISTSSNYRELQEDINIIFQWSVENLLTFNAAKCKCMLLSKKRTTTDPYPTMMLNDQPLEIVQQYKYLGLYLFPLILAGHLTFDRSATKQGEYWVLSIVNSHGIQTVLLLYDYTWLL